MPYALTVGGIAIAVGTIPAAYGIPGIITFPAGIFLLIVIAHFFGKKSMGKNALVEN